MKYEKCAWVTPRNTEKSVGSFKKLFMQKTGNSTIVQFTLLSLVTKESFLFVLFEFNESDTTPKVRRNKTPPKFCIQRLVGLVLSSKHLLNDGQEQIFRQNRRHFTYLNFQIVVGPFRRIFKNFREFQVLINGNYFVPIFLWVLSIIFLVQSSRIVH